jgi:phosphinothricin acetyltransferase
MAGRPDLEIRDVTAADAAAVAAIYDHYVLETVVTFEESAVPPFVMTERIAAVQEAGRPWLVAVEGDALVGYASASTWNPRSAYRHTVEVTAYLAPDATGRGVGSALYESLFARLTARDVHAAIAVIALPNPASVALHERFGLRPAGVFREVGRKFGRWVDVGFWQGLLSGARDRR